MGRERELAELRSAVEASSGGTGELVLLAGEAGIGKTRLVEEVSVEAKSLGLEVLWSRAWEGEGAPPFWPWVQIIRAHLRACDPEAVAEELGAGASYVAELVPEIRMWLPGIPAPNTPPDSESARFYLFDAVVGFLRNASAGRPLALLLDDLQWADVPSLLLLQALAPEIRELPILVVGTFREVEARQTPAVSAALDALVRRGRFLPLRGLTENEVARLVADVAGRPIAVDGVRAIHRSTDGNPFFVDEVVRVLLAEGHLDRGERFSRQAFPVPQGVREAIRRRVAPLPEESRRMLLVACILGREFDVSRLAAACGRSRTDALAALTPAVDHQIVRPGGFPGRFAFSHALVQEALYEEIPAAERARLHGAIGGLLERLHREHLDLHLPELAHHFGEAAVGGDVAKAVDYARRAADRALRLLAYEDAAEQYERALRLLALDPELGRPGELRAALLLGLGEAQNRAGRCDAARETLVEALETAEALGATALFARAALAYANVGPRLVTEPWHSDANVVRRLRRALALLPEGDDPLRARLLARLATELYWAPVPREEGDRLSREAVAMARRLGDAPTLGYALLARGASVDGLDDVQERLSIATEILGQPDALRDREQTLSALLWRIGDRLELGDVSTLNEDAETFIRLVDEFREPRYLWHARSLQADIALLRGRFEEAERIAAEILAIPEIAQNQSVVERFWALMFVVRREQGRIADLVDTVRGYVAGLPQAYAWRACLGALLVETDRIDEAREELRALAQVGLETFRRDMTWPATMALLAETSAAVGDLESAEVVYRALLPYRDRNVLVGDATAFYLGPVSHYLGVLTLALGRPDEAIGHLEAAVESASRLGALPFVVRARFALARARLARGAPGDRAAARSLLGEVEALARSIGLGRVLVEIERVAAVAGGPADAPPSSGRFVFRAEGPVWTIVYEGQRIELEDSKGLRYLAILLRDPGREFHAAGLAAALDAPDANDRLAKDPELAVAGGSDSGEMLDFRARREYQRRLEDLRAELEEAERFHDEGRSARLRGEIDFLGRELARALGLGGRSRRAQSSSERARLNVTRTIQAARRKIRDACPPLGRHLDSTVRTGTFCSYAPDPSAPIPWEL